MKTDYTHLILLIDRSGSMSTIKNTMESALKELLDDQKQVAGKCTLTAAQFDTEYEMICAMKEIQEVEDLTIDPRGCTALLDSMFKLIQDAGKQLDALVEEEKPSKVLFITITDGMENSSRHVTYQQLRTLITQQEEVYSWDFAYIGANQDAFEVGHSLGVRLDSCLNFDTSERGVFKMKQDLSHSMKFFRINNVRFNIIEKIEDEPKEDHDLNPI